MKTSLKSVARKWANLDMGAIRLILRWSSVCLQGTLEWSAKDLVAFFPWSKPPEIRLDSFIMRLRSRSGTSNTRYSLYISNLKLLTGFGILGKVGARGGHKSQRLERTAIKVPPYSAPSVGEAPCQIVTAAKERVEL